MKFILVVILAVATLYFLLDSSQAAPAFQIDSKTLQALSDILNSDYDYNQQPLVDESSPNESGNGPQNNLGNNLQAFQTAIRKLPFNKK